MFIDNLAIMLINLVAGFLLLAYFVYRDLVDEDYRVWASALGIVGTVQFATGLHTIFTWPLPGSFNITFGGLSVLFGTLFLWGALAVALRWTLFPVGVYAFFAGIAAIVVGARFIDLNLTQQPLVAGIGFIVSGLAAIILPFAVLWRTNMALRIVFAVLAVIAALIWGFIGYVALWEHIQEFGEWVPATLRR